jgi:methionyl-tRNA formyltransferase
MNNLRVLFMGTPDFALPSCEVLIQNYQLVGVVTQPDRPKGRGGKTLPPPVKVFANENDIPVWQPTILKDGAFQSVLDETRPDLIVVAAYGRILPEYILNYPQFGCINVHGSLLPEYRGAAPIQRAVIDGKKETGVTIMKMAKGMDTGDMILKQAIPIGANDTAGSIFDKLAVLGAELLQQAIEQIVSGNAEYISQDDSLATYAPMIDKSEAKLDFSKNAEFVRCLIMGMNPSPGAFLEVDDYRIKIHTALIGNPTKQTSGKICAISPEGIEVACGDGMTIILKEVQKQGKNKTDAYSYACGAKLAVGEYFR